MDTPRPDSPPAPPTASRAPSRTALAAPAARTARPSPGWSTPAKGLAIAMVVAFHATLYLKDAGVDVALGRGKVALELYPMPAFFLVVGMAAASHRRLGLGALWWRRLAPLLYLYVLWSLIRTVFYLVVPGLGGGLGELSATDPRSLALLLVWPSSSYWFLHALLIFTLVRWLVARAPAWAQLAGSALVSTAFTSGLVATGDVGWDRVGGLFFFFTAGAVLAAPVKAAVASARPRHLVALALAGASVTLALLLGLRWVPLLVLLGQVVAVGFGAVLCALLPAGRAPLGLLRRALSALGEETFTIYLIHLFLIVPVAAAISAAGAPPGSRGVGLAVQLALSAASLYGSYLLARQVRRVRWLYLPPAWMLPARRRPAARPAAASHTSSTRTSTRSVR